MKKNILFIFIFCFSFSLAKAQTFGSSPYLNQQSWDSQRVFYGYFIGFNFYNFKYNYTKEFYNKYPNSQILVSNEIGFNVGLVGDLRLFKYLNLRFEPGLYYAKRSLLYPHVQNEILREKQLTSTYINLPLLLKYSAKRTGNIRPYVLGGISESYNFGAREDFKEDNYEDVFRMKKWTTNYELGVGIDLYFNHFILSPSIRGVFGLQDELIRDNRGEASEFTGGIESLQTRGVFVNFTFH